MCRTYFGSLNLMASISTYDNAVEPPRAIDMLRCTHHIAAMQYFIDLP